MVNLRKEPIYRWVIENGVMLFWGNGGTFTGELFEKWFETIKSNPLRGYVGGAGASFSLQTADRKRANDYFKLRSLPFSAVVESKVLIATVTAAKWVGVKIAAFPVSQSREAVAWLGVLSPEEIETLTKRLLALRDEVEAELHPQRANAG